MKKFMRARSGLAVLMLAQLLAGGRLEAKAAEGEKGPVSRFPNLPAIYDAIVYLPKGFASMESSQAKNLFIAIPFNKPENLLINERYVHFDEPFISIVKLVYKQAYRVELASFGEQELEANKVVLIHQEQKVFGAKGTVVYLRQLAQGRWFHKWIAVYGNATQTNIIVAAFPEYRVEQWGKRLRRVVELAKMGQAPL